MVLCLYGAASNNIHPDFMAAVEELGRELGKRGHTLLFGGGAQGLMGAAARGAHASGGRIIGVAPRFFDKEGVLYPCCDEFYFTDTMRQRKTLLEEKADAFAAVPGGVGTFDELFEIVTLRHLGRHDKPIAVFNVRGYFDPLQTLLDNAVREGFLSAEGGQLCAMFDSAPALLDALEAQVSDRKEVRK